jgi:hypothetical protein
MANLLNQRTNNNDDIIKGRFVRKKLAETANEIREGSNKRMNGFRSGFWNNRSFSVTDNELQYEHLKVHRFIDMRTRTLKSGEKRKKKFYPIHNRVVMGQYSQLVRELSFGFTEEVKNQLRSMGD